MYKDCFNQHFNVKVSDFCFIVTDANPGTVQSRPANSLTAPLLSDELEELGEDQDGGGTEEENLGIARQQTTRDSMHLRELKLSMMPDVVPQW